MVNFHCQMSSGQCGHYFTDPLLQLTQIQIQFQIQISLFLKNITFLSEEITINCSAVHKDWRKEGGDTQDLS
jgi:hypothetical protein